jgi:hypothetical protein
VLLLCVSVVVLLGLAAWHLQWNRPRALLRVVVMALVVLATGVGLLLSQEQVTLESKSKSRTKKHRDLPTRLPGTPLIAPKENITTFVGRYRSRIWSTTAQIPLDRCLLSSWYVFCSHLRHLLNTFDALYKQCAIQISACILDRRMSYCLCHRPKKG